MRKDRVEEMMVTGTEISRDGCIFEVYLVASSQIQFELIKWKIRLYYEEPNTRISQNPKAEMQLHLGKGLEPEFAVSHHSLASSFLFADFPANWYTLWAQEGHPITSRFVSSLIKTPGQIELESSF